MPIMVMAISPNVSKLVQPKSAPRVMTRLRATIAMMKTINPLTSNLDSLVLSTLLSDTSLIIHIAKTAKTIEKIKIHRQPIYVAIAPPANEQTPEPPQDPIDQ